MDETCQSNTLDRPSLVLLLFFSTILSFLMFFSIFIAFKFSGNLDISFQLLQKNNWNGTFEL